MSGAAVCGAALCAGGSVWLLGGRMRAARGTRRARSALSAGDAARAPWWHRWSARVRGRLGREVWLLPGGALVGLLSESLLPLVAAAVGLPLASRVHRERQARRERERRVGAVIALCGALACEVRAGRHPTQALQSAAESGEAVERGLGGARTGVLAAARFGGDVPGALREAAREPGAEGLVGLAACWRVAVDRGAGLAAGLERLEGTLRAERDQEADLRAQLAGARSTALMLAGLPALGLLMGAALGAAPLRVLLHTGPGLVCLLVGGLLEGAGAWWALRIVRRAEGRGR
ncbi:type II secretion system F family protein [Streptomyces silvensis]|uniref:type II secretion system F family protein n=1 Tax=Streptomyces silvensis TaxID=1765722 RepID=UPI001F51AA9B|nr:type II secretion system F family protein [Streptomyces silvensis]